MTGTGPATAAEVVRTALRVAATLTLLLAAYALLSARAESDWVRVLVFAVVVALLFLIVWQIRSILGSKPRAART